MEAKSRIPRDQAYYAACREYELNPTKENRDEMLMRLDLLNEYCSEKD